jgi:hypothetical protein
MTPMRAKRPNRGRVATGHDAELPAMEFDVPEEELSRRAPAAPMLHLTPPEGLEHL